MKPKKEHRGEKRSRTAKNGPKISLRKRHEKCPFDFSTWRVLGDSHFRDQSENLAVAVRPHQVLAQTLLRLLSHSG